MPTSVRMFAWAKRHLNEDELATLRDEMVERFQPLDDQIFRPGGPLIYADAHDREDIPVQGKPGVLLDVNLCRVYYGFGYERGHLPLIVEVAEWLEGKLPGCVIFYGGDHTDQLLLFDEPGRKKLLNYYSLVGNQPYRSQDAELKRRLRDLYET